VGEQANIRGMNKATARAADWTRVVMAMLLTLSKRRAAKTNLERPYGLILVKAPPT
jgi:hypothetical protein